MPGSAVSSHVMRRVKKESRQPDGKTSTFVRDAGGFINQNTLEVVAENH
jgi:hypothetical protein